MIMQSRVELENNCKYVVKVTLWEFRHSMIYTMKIALVFSVTAVEIDKRT